MQNYPTLNYVKISNAINSSIIGSYQAESSASFSNISLDISNADRINIEYASRLQTNEVDYTVITNLKLS